MAKFKFDFTGEEFAALHNSDEREDMIAELHEALDVAIDDIDNYVKCSVTMDTEKDKE